MAPSIDIVKEKQNILASETLVSLAEEDYEFDFGDVLSEQMIRAALVEEVEKIDHDVCAAGEEDSFFVADLGQVFRSFQKWKRELPRVQPFYAVKCNTDTKVVELLGHLGANFDCASKNEIEKVLALGFDLSRIIYANPCKTNSFIRYACDKKVDLTTVDNVQELYKLHKFHPTTRVLVRIITDDESAQCRLSTKFGCSVDVAVKELLPVCVKLGIDVAGVAFHVGSGAKCFKSFFLAIRDARQIFDAGREMGLRMKVLDIGGGFEKETFAESARVVNQSLDAFFPATYAEQHDIQFIAEPGRFMVADAFTLATHVIARRDLCDDRMEAMVYINDGVYGNLNCILFDHQTPTARVLKHGQGSSGLGEQPVEAGRCGYSFSIWGPTCDGLDCVSLQAVLPVNVGVGDWLYFPKVGAYTSAATTSFNGFSGRANVKYISSVDLGHFSLDAHLG